MSASGDKTSAGGNGPRVEELFHAALERPPDQRADFLAEACGEDHALRAELEALLASDAQTATLGAPVQGLLDAGDAARWIGRRVGSYELRSVIASGGMGIVFEAEQDRPRRVVAVKLMRAGLASPSVLKRFQFEAEVLGRLQHPSIARIYEAGLHDEGPLVVPYFAMEFVPDATTIVAYAQSRALDVEQRVNLFAIVCDAVQEGHQKGVVHRDLKPSNILVDGRGQPKVIDFGVARATDADLALTGLHTGLGELIGTLPYMSPEQTQADPTRIDVRSDVYALGVVLYELLCGRLPYDVGAVALPEAARIIQEQGPRRPSTLMATLRGDLETVVLRALAKEPDRRYASAGTLAADLRRFLRREPIEARPTTVGYHLGLLARRHKVVFGLAAALLVVLIAAVVVSGVYGLEAERQRVDAVAARAAMKEERDAAVEARESEAVARRKAEAITQFLMDLWSSALPRVARGRDTTLVRDILDAAADRIDGGDADPAVEAVVRRLLGRVYFLLPDPARAEPHLSRSVALHDELFGREHADTLRVMMSHSAALAGIGRYDEAEALAREVVDTRRRTLGDRDPATLGAMRDLSSLYQMLGRLDRAEPLLTTAYRAQLEVHGPAFRDTIVSGIDLAGVLDDLERDAEAEALLQTTLEHARPVMGPDHPETLRAINNLARLFFVAGRWTEAEPMQIEVCDGAERMLGPRHPDTLTARHTLGLVHQRLGRPEQARAVFEEVMKARSETLGQDHLATLQVGRDLVLLLRETGENQAGLQLLRELVERARASLPDEHPAVTQLSELLAECEKSDRHE